MKTLIGLSRARYTYVLYIFIDEAKCKIKIVFSKTKCIAEDIEKEVKP